MAKNEPAKGERRAITGYYPQYKISAALIIKQLREEKLRWIRVADPEAGRVDDLQLCSESCVDAYQIKWARYGGNVTFNDFITVRDNAPCLIAQLAEGWQRLRNNYQPLRVIVHLATNQIPSTSDRLPANETTSTANHFAAFLEQVWKPACKNAEFQIPEEWQAAWQRLQEASELSIDEFRHFAKDCEFEFGYPLPGLDTPASREGQVYQDDLKHVFHTLFETVFDPQQIIQLERDKLLDRLGWKQRFEYRNQHDFPVDEFLYQPIEASTKAIECALTQNTTGYLAVIGTPGSGKSSLVTQTLRYRTERVIRYYAYVPDSPSFLWRGEAANFLHDVVKALEGAGFRAGASASSFDRMQLLARFQQQLQMLHEDWRTNGRKTIILIDGLDHIPREQKPEHSLLRDLPLPEQLPDGVLILLGSQSDELADLPDRVQHAIRQPERRIEMVPLSRQAVGEIVGRVNLPCPLSSSQREQIYDLSAGHPLALGYLLNRLLTATDSDEAEEVLQTAHRYEGRIEAEYHSYWRQIATDDGLIHLLGLIARLRGGIDLRWIESWADHGLVNRLRRTLHHYFRREGLHQWYFFHNSFCLYLIERTKEIVPGEVDPTRDAALHQELARHCREASEARWQWEEFYHLAQAQNHEAILQCATPAKLRDQFFQMRPAEAIHADIRLASNAALLRRDVVALTRLVLADEELAHRTYNIESATLAPLLLSLGEERTAADLVRDGRRLRIPAKEAIVIAMQFRHLGLMEEAQRIFELCEPLELLSGAKFVESNRQREQQELLELWAEAAVNFRKLDDILAAIRRMREEANQFEDVDEATATRYLRNNLLYRVGISLAAHHRWEDLIHVDTLLDDPNMGEPLYWFWLRVGAWDEMVLKGEGDRASDLLRNTVVKTDPNKLSSKQRVYLAEAIFKILGDEELARRLLQDAPSPKLQTQLLNREVGLRPFEQRFRFCRLHYLLGDQRSPIEMIPDTVNTREQGMVYFERGVCLIAKLWASGWRGQQLDGSTIVQECFPLLRLFNRSWHSTNWDSWYVAQGIRGEFYARLIEATAWHGKLALDALRAAFEREWQSTDTARFWPTDVRRQVVLAFRRNSSSHNDHAWALEQLRGIELDILAGPDEIRERINECIEQVKGWIAVREKDAARDLLHKALRMSAAIGEKDYQLNSWIEWLGLINQLEPDAAPNRVKWFAKAIELMERDGGPAKDAAQSLLEVVFQWSPRSAVQLYQWFFNHGLVWFDRAMRRIVQAALAQPNPPVQIIQAMMTEFILPLCDSGAQLAQGFIEQAYAQRGKTGAITTAQELLVKAEIYTHSTQRRGWCFGVAKALLRVGIKLDEVGIDSNDLRSEADGSYSDRTLKLKDGSQFSMAEIEARLTSVADLRAMLNEAEDSYFGWKEVLSEWSAKLAVADLHAVADLFDKHLHASAILSNLSERLLALGDVGGARSVAMRALARSGSYGWMHRTDGGTRLAAFKALVAADVNARQSVFEVLQADLNERSLSPGSLAESLAEVLPLLSEEVPVQSVWREIEEYVRQYFPLIDGEALTVEFADVISAPCPYDTSARTLADLLTLHTTSPINLIAHSAQRACISLLLQNDPAIQDAVADLLRKSERGQECGLMMLDAVSLVSPELLTPFESELAILGASPNFSIRSLAQELADRAGFNLPVPTAKELPLPTMYSLVLPSGPRVEDMIDEIKRPDPAILSGDDLTASLSLSFIELSMIASCARLPKENVFRRAAQIVRELADLDEWAVLGEGKMRALFEQANLRLPYERPRYTLARRAMHRVVAELYDAGRFGPESLRELNFALRHYDPAMFLFSPQPRPSWVEGLSDQPGVQTASRVQPNEPSPRRTPDGWTILAERSKFKRFESRRPSLLRETVLQSDKTTMQLEEQDLFYQVYHCNYAEYFFYKEEAALQKLVIQNIDWGYASPGDGWVAFNPVLAQQLNWSPMDSQNKLFAWQDQHGEIMVYTLWWNDGTFDSATRHFNDEGGKGWLVLAKLEAYAKIQAYFDQPLTEKTRLVKGNDGEEED